MKKIFNNKNLIILISCILILIVFLLTFINKEEKYEEEVSLNTIYKTNETTTKGEEKFYVDVKGSVKKPGVYEFKENDRVIDAIKMAGGLKNKANTSNINLSEKLKSEMVIYVYSNEEIKKGNKALTCDTICNPTVIEVNNCIENSTTSNPTNNLININTATIEE